MKCFPLNLFAFTLVDNVLLTTLLSLDINARIKCFLFPDCKYSLPVNL